MFLAAFWCSLGLLFGLSWAAFWPLLGLLGCQWTLLGLSWTHLGPFWSLLGPVLAPPGEILRSSRPSCAILGLQQAFFESSEST